MLYVIAQLIGLYPILFLALLLGLILGIIFLLRYLFGVYYKDLWHRASHLWQWIRSLPVTQHLLEKYPALRAFFGRRLSPSGYLGIHLTIGALLALLAGAGWLAVVISGIEVVRRLPNVY